MMKRSLGVLLLAAGVSGSAWAQGGALPAQSDPKVMLDPVPEMVALPQAPPQEMARPSPVSLRGDTPNAWTIDRHYEPNLPYASIGYMGFFRGHMGHTMAVLQDPVAGDTGNPPSGPVFGTFDDLNPRMTHGFHLLAGYHWGTSAIEVGGFYLSQSNSFKTFTSPGRLDTFFNTNGSFTSFPLGFEGDNGIGLQNDVVTLQLKTAMASGELNYRTWIGNDYNFSYRVGVRYLDIYERFAFHMGDDDLTDVDAAGNPNPVHQATYYSTTHNRLLAPQLGIEWNKAINCWLAFTLQVQGAWGVNFMDTDVALKRGDQFVGFTGHHSDTIFSHMYQAGFFADFYLRETIRFRAGYQMLWVVDVAEAVDQIDFNLANHNGLTKNEGSIFYHGPVAEFHLLF